jgi:tetratricopeptide (TPR) repeat protein
VVLWSASTVYHDRFWASDTALWRRIAEVDPGNPAAFDWLGAQAVEAGDLDAAEALYRRSMAADPGSPLGAWNLAVLLHVRRAHPADALPYYERALAAFRRLEPRYHDEHLNAWINYGACLDQVGRHADALQVFLDARRTPPHPARAFANAAVLLQQEGRFRDVEAVLVEGLGWHPQDAVLSRMLAETRRSAPRPSVP